jgi:hypothetical protein
MKIGIVCGYGNVLDENLTNYVNFVISYIKQSKIDTLILSGGCTFTSSNISEAKLMNQLIEPEKLGINIYLEEASLTTLHNLLYSKPYLDSCREQPDLVYIYCDQVRQLKLYCLAKIILKDFRIKVIAIPRKEKLVYYFLQIPSILIQCMGAIFPLIENLILVNKQNWIKKYR